MYKEQHHACTVCADFHGLSIHCLPYKDCVSVTELLPAERSEAPCIDTNFPAVSWSPLQKAVNQCENTIPLYRC